MIKTVNLEELPVDVVFNIIQGNAGDYDTKPEADSVNIQQVLLGGIDITKALEAAKFDFGIIEADILENL